MALPAEPSNKHLILQGKEASSKRMGQPSLGARQGGSRRLLIGRSYVADATLHRATRSKRQMACAATSFHATSLHSEASRLSTAATPVSCLQLAAL